MNPNDPIGHARQISAAMEEIANVIKKLDDISLRYHQLFQDFLNTFNTLMKTSQQGEAEVDQAGDEEIRLLITGVMNLAYREPCAGKHPLPANQAIWTFERHEPCQAVEHLSKN